MILLSWTGIYARLVPTEYGSYGSYAADSVINWKIQIEFPINRWDVDSTYCDNAEALRDLYSLLQETRSNPLLSLDSLKVSGYASPDGSLYKNKELSVRRAVSLYNYLKHNCGVSDSLMSFGDNIVPWALFREFISQSEYPWRSDALNILSKGNDNNAADNTRRMNRLKRFAGGEAWRVVKHDILPKLRSAFVVSTIITLQPPQPEETEIPDKYAIEELVDTVIYNDIAPTESAPVRTRDYDRFAIKTNAAYLAAGVTNIGAEYAFGAHWSLDLPLVYSPYTLAQNYRMRFLYIQPELRYWTGKALRRHFVGVHMQAGVFNVSLDHKNRYQSEKGFHGAGISYGYSLPVSCRWSIEFTAGVGYTYTKYSAYFNVPNGKKFKDDVPYHYWGLDKLGINIVYRFGDKSGKRKETRP